MPDFTFKASLYPASDNTYSIGTPQRRWKFYGSLAGDSTTTKFLRDDGVWTNVLKGPLDIHPSSGTEGGEIHLGASETRTTESGITLDQYQGNLRIFGIPSADGRTVTGVGTPLIINPYTKEITAEGNNSYTYTGHSTLDLALTGGTVTGAVTFNSNITCLGSASLWATTIQNSLLCYTKTPGVRQTNEGSAIEIREVNQVGNSQTSWNYAPKIGFHWAATAACELGMNKDQE